MASVKPEPAVKADPEDAAAGASPAVMSDDDLYEDAGDLEFYDPNIPGDPNGNLFLAHVPPYLYEAWAQMNEGEEVEVGKMRRWTETDKNGQTRTRMAMLLDGRNSSHQSIPKEYNFDMRDTNLLNTFVFTEQDLPGFKSKAQGANSNIPGHLRNRFNRNQNNNNNAKQEGGRKRYQPYYRKAIPKKTVLAGRFKYEVNCHPANTAESKHLLAVRNSESAIPKATTSMMSGTRAMTKNIIHAGTLTGNAKMSGFIVSTIPCPRTCLSTNSGASKLRMPRPRSRSHRQSGLLVWIATSCLIDWLPASPSTGTGP